MKRKFINAVLLYLLGFFLLPFLISVKAFSNEGQFFSKDSVQASAQWNSILRSEKGYYVMASRKDTIQKIVYRQSLEDSLMSVRNRGLIFWNQFPGDIRRYEWLEWTVEHAPNYYNYINGKFNITAQTAWENEYTEIRQQYITYESSLPSRRSFRALCWFDILELRNIITRGKFRYKMSGSRFPIINYQQEFATVFQKAVGSDFFVSAKRLGDIIVSGKNTLGLSKGEIRRFLLTLEKMNIVQVNDWINGKLSLLSLDGTPLNLMLKTYDGTIINLREMKGRVVLIDFWATWCSSCLAYFPAIKELYRKYHKKGFEVISVSLNKTSELAGVLAVKSKFGVSFPLTVIGDQPVKDSLWKRFSFDYIPQMLLIDRNGFLINNDGQLFTPSELQIAVERQFNNNQGNLNKEMP